MTESKDLKDLLRKAITPKCLFRMKSEDVTVIKVTECKILSLQEGNFIDSNYSFTALANLSMSKGEDFTEDTYNLDGFFDVNNDEEVVIKGKISITKR